MNPLETVPVAPARVFATLSIDDLRRCAPSVFAAQARPGVSSRYTFVSSLQVITLLHDHGWEPVRAREQRVRLDTRAGYQLHEIRFARRVDLVGGQELKVGGVRPEMILQNAHDGTRAYRIDAGLYRLVCRNGLTVADADFAHVSIRHMDVSADAFVAAARSVAENTPRALDTVAQWQAITLLPETRLEFARRAAALRWDAESPLHQAVSPESLLQSVRYGDAAPDLWTTFNVVQEHLVRGGNRYVVRHGLHTFRRNRTRALGGLLQGQRLNKELWHLAAEFARN